MDRSRLRLWRLAAFSAFAVPLIIYEYLRRSPWDSLMAAPTVHFVIVSLASFLAGLFAVLIGVAGQSQRNVQVTFLATSFSSLAFLFTLHGLSTPGFILDRTPVTGIAAQLSILTASIWLALSSLSSDAKFVGWVSRSLGGLVWVWTSLLILLVASGLARPSWWALIPINAPPIVWFVTVATLFLALFAAFKYWRAFVFSRMPLPCAVLFASLWIGVAQWIMATSTVWRQSWWIYHYLLLAAVFALLLGVALQYAKGQPLSRAVHNLLLADPIERLEVGLSPGARALVAATEARDAYTAGHNYRVAVTAVRIGQELRLSPIELRALAIGGLMHDVGKIEIPDQILNKPGPLTDEERRIINTHPENGYRICRTVGFMKDELGIIKHHHERWDGQGYPDGLAGEEIPKLARVLAIADVYDALTSTRSYRAARSHFDAYEIILSGSGTQFDPACVSAWATLAVDGPIIASEHGAPWSHAAEPSVL